MVRYAVAKDSLYDTGECMLIWIAFHKRFERKALDISLQPVREVREEPVAEGMRNRFTKGRFVGEYVEIKEPTRNTIP